MEALEKIPVFAPSIVITDVKMPRMGGMELVEKLADLSQSIAVVMVTAQKTTDTAFHAGRLGVQDYIEKPIDFRRLRSILTNIGEILNTRTENETLRRTLARQGSARPPGRLVARNAGDLPADRAGGPEHGLGADYRRERHRQGTGGAHHPRPESAPQQAFRSRSIARPFPKR